VGLPEPTNVEVRNWKYLWSTIDSWPLWPPLPLPLANVILCYPPLPREIRLWNTFPNWRHADCIFWNPSDLHPVFFFGRTNTKKINNGNRPNHKHAHQLYHHYSPTCTAQTMASEEPSSSMAVASVSQLETPAQGLPKSKPRPNQKSKLEIAATCWEESGAPIVFDPVSLSTPKDLHTCGKTPTGLPCKGQGSKHGWNHRSEIRTMQKLKKRRGVNDGGSHGWMKVYLGSDFG
jgi:hypothetical protein